LFNCIRGFTSACLTVNPEIAGGAFGYTKKGPFRGAQAELLRVPSADFNCTKLPGTPGDKWEDDFELLADIFPTGYYATKLAMVQPCKWLYKGDNQAPKVNVKLKYEI
jgi:glutathione-independent formaldehyde dehydrogenase